MPNCKVPVHKTDGCDQMFCTQCKRLWSWNTGRFETRGHNPHYLQWMRDNGGMPRDPNDVLCGREIDPRLLHQLNDGISHTLRRTMAHMPLPDHEVVSNQLHVVFNFIGSIPHLRFHDLPRFITDRTNINLHARKAFVSNSMSLARFKQTTRRNHLLAIKHDNIAQLLHAVIQAATDIAFRFQHELQLYTHTPINTITFASFPIELNNLHTYANQELNAIHTDFNSTTLQRWLFKHDHFKLTN